MCRRNLDDFILVVGVLDIELLGYSVLKKKNIVQKTHVDI